MLLVTIFWIGKKSVVTDTEMPAMLNRVWDQLFADLSS